MHIKGIHNTVANAISRLDFGPVKDEKANWMTFTKCRCHYTMHAPTEESTHTHQHQINMVFANRSEEDVIYPLRVKEIAQAQKDNAVPKKLSKTDKYFTKLVEDTQVLCKDGKMVIPKALQNRAVSWYHHYLQHPGHTGLEETLHTVIYWKGLRHTIRSHVKNCHICQVNKQHKHKYGKLPAKLVITNCHQKSLGGIVCRPRCKVGTKIDFMCLTMIDPASSWFEIVELLVTTAVVIPMDTNGQRGTKTHNNTKLLYFDKSSAKISNLVNKTWFSRYPHCQ